MNRILPIGLVAVVLAAVFAWWLFPDRSYSWGIDGSLPPPAVPVDNPMTDDKVELGRRLFYDTRLSVNNTMSCATCHLQALAFTDGRARAVGATGQFHPRGAMTLVNVAYASRLTWANPLLDRLEDQALTPLFGDQPVEMGMSGRDQEIVEMLRGDALYAELVSRAFPQEQDPYSIVSVVRAMAAFVRSIISFTSPYDVYLRGDSGAARY